MQCRSWQRCDASTGRAEERERTSDASDAIFSILLDERQASNGTQRVGESKREGRERAAMFGMAFPSSEECEECQRFNYVHSIQCTNI